MDEKIIARSKLYNIEKIKKMCIVLGAILFFYLSHIIVTPTGK